MKTIHHCKLHGEPYTVCPLCGCEYCVRTWPVCPRTSWHPSHADTTKEMGQRYATVTQAVFCADCGKNITNHPANGPSHECKQQRAANRKYRRTL